MTARSSKGLGGGGGGGEPLDSVQMAVMVGVGGCGPGNDDGGAGEAVLMGVVLAVGKAMRRETATENGR